MAAKHIPHSYRYSDHYEKAAAIVCGRNQTAETKLKPGRFIDLGEHQPEG